MKMYKICLILGFLTIFSGCSLIPYNKQEERPKVTIEKHIIAIPSSLLQHFCTWKKDVATVGELSDSYVHNTLCGMKYAAQVEEQQQYIDKMMEEENDPRSK